MKTFSHVCAILMIAFALVFSTFFVSTIKANPAQNTLYIAINWNDTIDPSQAMYSSEIQIIDELFAGLVKIDPITGESEPDLAQSWGWNLAKTEITFTLRPGLVWSDSHPLTASDARFSILRVLNPDHEAPYAGILFPIINAEAYNNGSITNPDLVGVYADSPTQLRIQLAQPMVFFEKIISLWVAHPLPQHVIDLHPYDWSEPQYMVESGPYSLASYSPEYIQLVQNPLYYGPAPDITQVEVTVSSDSEANWNAFLMGQLDTVFMPPPHWDSVQFDPVLLSQFTEYAGVCTTVLSFKTDVNPFSNINTRKALIAAIDRVDFNERVNGSQQFTTLTFSPPPVFGYVDGAAEGIGIPSDVIQAQTYLTLAGYPNGAGFPSVTVQVRDSGRNRARWNYFEDAWQDNLNITINIEYISTNPPPQPINLIGWCADYPEAYNFVNDGVRFLQNVGRLGDWQNSDYDDLIDTITQTENPNDRLLLYKQAEEILVETDAVIGPLFNNFQQELTRPYLTRTHNEIGSNFWHTWTIDTTDFTAYDPAVPQTFTPNVDAVEYDLPAGLFVDPVTLTHTALRMDEIPPSPNWLGSTGVAFTLTAAPPKAGSAPLAQTLIPYTITVPYSYAGILPEGINLPERLQVFALVGSTWVAEPSVVDINQFTVTVTTQEINTTFVLWGDMDYVFLPIITR